MCSSARARVYVKKRIQAIDARVLEKKHNTQNKTKQKTKTTPPSPPKTKKNKPETKQTKPTPYPNKRSGQAGVTAPRTLFCCYFLLFYFISFSYLSIYCFSPTKSPLLVYKTAGATPCRCTKCGRRNPLQVYRMRQAQPLAGVQNAAGATPCRCTECGRRNPLQVYRMRQAQPTAPLTGNTRQRQPLCRQSDHGCGSCNLCADNRIMDVDPANLCADNRIMDVDPATSVQTIGSWMWILQPLCRQPDHGCGSCNLCTDNRIMNMDPATSVQTIGSRMWILQPLCRQSDHGCGSFFFNSSYRTMHTCTHRHLSLTKNRGGRRGEGGGGGGGGGRRMRGKECKQLFVRGNSNCRV